MKKKSGLLGFVLFTLVFSPSILPAQDKKLDKIRVGGGSASTTQMSLWLAKEGNYFDKHGLNVEAISIPGSSLALQAMLAGELPIIQLGGAASIQANLAGADTVIIATIVRKFLFWVYAVPGINRMYTMVRVIAIEEARRRNDERPDIQANRVRCILRIGRRQTEPVGELYQSSRI